MVVLVMVPKILIPVWVTEASNVTDFSTLMTVLMIDVTMVILVLETYMRTVIVVLVIVSKMMIVLLLIHVMLMHYCRRNP